MKYIISLSKDTEEYNDCENLVYSVYQGKGFLQKKMPKLDVNSRFLIVKSFETNELLGCVSISFPTTGFESEYFFGITINDYLPKSIERGQIVEIGRLSKLPSLKSDFVFVALQLAIAQFLEQNNYKGWIATMKPSLINSLAAFGHTLTVLDCSIQNGTELVASLGDYFNVDLEPKLVLNIPIDGGRQMKKKCEFLLSRVLERIDI